MSDAEVEALEALVATDPLVGWRTAMTKRAFDKIADGLREAIAIARGEKKPAKVFIPPELEVRSVRAKLRLSQEEFAYAFGFTVHQIRQLGTGSIAPARCRARISDGH
jgi:DNA-binding transcriptional regulator YiaG